jgi:predicted small lipoprotein YifL
LKAALLCAALACAALAGCGQTGALYLPEKEGEVVSKGPAAAAPTSTTAPADTSAASPADAEAARKREQRQPAPQ